ncbi:MAG: acylphosphatase [Candidatus Firestonebacteria bacterium]|nr:acylphosphatase [Candidatus Firestonebacteria bacterium]
MIHAHIIVSGQVQGVGYRAFVLREAEIIGGISGRVRNMSDGVRVEIIAEGSSDDINTLIERLWQGPYHSKVKNVEVNKHNIKENRFNNFIITY